MSRRPRLALWLISLATLSAVAATLDQPGSPDACYHFHVAKNLAAGRGMVEDLVWTYLDESDAALALPHESHLYWMPLATWLAWLGITLFGALFSPFTAAQVPFVLLASLVPLLAYEIANELWERGDHAWLAGLLALCAPSYLQVWVVPESVTPFCLVVALCFLFSARAQRGAAGWWLLSGAAAAAAHLARADGLLALLAALVFALQRGLPGWRGRTIGPLLLLAGYLLAVAPWFARNVAIIGSPLPTSVSRSMWLHSYDEFFSYALPLTAGRWFSAPASELLGERLQGALTTIVQFGGMFQWVIPPLVVMGARRARHAKKRLLEPCAIYALFLLVTMSVIFTHPAQFGSLFRGASALVPWAMALVPEGLRRLSQAYAKVRRTGAAGAEGVFRAGLVSAIVIVALMFHVHRLHGLFSSPRELWNLRLQHYTEIDRWLRAQGETGPVLVVDPPGFTLATGRSSIVVPSDGPGAVQDAADRFGARWLILESNIPSLLAAYRSGEAVEGFTHVREFRDALGARVRLLARAGPQLAQPTGANRWLACAPATIRPCQRSRGLFGPARPLPNEAGDVHATTHGTHHRKEPHHVQEALHF